jgi:ABC-type sugar transport system substrate-binding protein
MVEETVYNYVDSEGNFVDESKASKTMLNVLKQYPYNFDDFLNPNLEMLNVFKYTTTK